MSSMDVFRRVIERLERVGTPYMLTGSFASSFHGVPRATQDIDLGLIKEWEDARRLAGITT